MDIPDANKFCEMECENHMNGGTEVYIEYVDG